MKPGRFITVILATIAILAVFAPVSADACAACYGKSNDKMAQGLNWSILLLLVVIGSVLVGIASFFVYIIRRAATLERAAAAASFTEIPNKV